MRVLTVRQPWAWAIVHGGKDVENRVRNIAGDYRGPVAIHVAGKYAETGLNLDALDDACDEWCASNGCGDHPWFKGVGDIIGVVDLVDVHQAADCWDSPGYCSRWADGVWHLVLANARPLVLPIPYRGALGLRRLDEAMVQQVLAAVAS